MVELLLQGVFMFVLLFATIAKVSRGARSIHSGRTYLLGFLVFLFSPSSPTNAQPFTDIAAGLPGMGMSSVAWGDYDGDGDLDMLLTGSDTFSNTYAEVHENIGAGSFQYLFTGLTGVYGSSVAWGDYDNDGDLDLLLTGASAGPISQPISRVYRGDGTGGFQNSGAALTGVQGSSVAWGDYDNDGDLDILLTGIDNGGTARSLVYRNDGAGGFHDISAGLVGVFNSSAAWGDYDKDGDLDILLTGAGSGGGTISAVYRSDGGNFINIAAGLTGVRHSSVAWGDYDKDGDLDILLTGRDNGGTPRSLVYRNDGVAGFHNIATTLPGVETSSVAWGDHDNDGDLDILLTGNTGANAISRVYRNDGAGGFQNISAGLPGVSYSSVAWGDHDKDGDLDILLTGLGGDGTTISRVYRNENPTANAAPSVPANLAALRSYDQVTFSWTGASDDHTPAAGLSYNLRIGTTPGGNEVMAAMAAPNGYRSVARLGNSELRTSWSLALPDGIYYWSVQAIDGAFLGSSFASEETLTPPFTEMSSGLPGVHASSVAWGDYDNDGDLDILLTGTNGTNFISRVYRNDGDGNFIDIGAGLQGVSQSSVAWGDYDNDGDLDILLTGYPGAAAISRIYRNDGATAFHDISAGLPGVSVSSAAWGDYDNDGDLDILLTGAGSAIAISRVYRNNGNGSFSDISAGLPGVYYSSVAWGDYDADADLDILLTGSSDFGAISRVYRNDGNGSFNDISAGLPGVEYSSAAWGDCDNDGDLDILLTGASNSGVISRVYRNTGGGAFGDVSANLPGVYFSSAAWGDQDNDGYLDVLLTGYDGGFNPLSRVYWNYGGGTFLEVPSVLSDASQSSVAWGDYDNDGDLDVLLSGYGVSGPITRVYRNETPAGNAVPSAPTNLTMMRNGNQLTLSWLGATDDHTPTAALTYNLRIGTTPVGNQVLPAMAAANGYRRIVRAGNVQGRTSWTLTLPEGSYYWGVQAIDGSFLGSQFAQGGEPTGLEETLEAPTAHILSPGKPNPFAISTVLTYAIPSPSPVNIAVFDAAGRNVRTLVSGPAEAGVHSVRWDGRDSEGNRLAAGVYFVRFEGAASVLAQKVVLTD